MSKVCHAPILESNNFFACLFLGIIYGAAIGALIIGTFGLIFFSAAGRCLINQFRYRITHCTDGNNNPDIPI